MDDATLKRMGEMAYVLYESDPDVKAKLDEAAEKTYPGIHAKVTTEKATKEAVAQIAKERAQFKLEMEAERAARVRQAEIDKIKSLKDLRIKDDEVPEVEKHMLERGIGNYEDGAYSYRRAHQIALPQSAGPASTLEVPGLGEDGMQGGLEWMKGVIGANGVNLALLDKRARMQKDTILADYKRDPQAAEAKWGAQQPTSRWMGVP